MLNLSSALFYCRLISNRSSMTMLSRWETSDLHAHPIHSFSKSPLPSYHSSIMGHDPPPPPPPLLFPPGKNGPSLLQMSLVSGTLTAQTNFSINFISRENSESIGEKRRIIWNTSWSGDKGERGSGEMDRKRHKSKLDCSFSVVFFSIKKTLLFLVLYIPLHVTLLQDLTMNQSSTVCPFVALLQPASH